MFHLSCYAASLGSVTDADVAAGPDDVLQRRNGHLLISEPFDLIASHSQGSLTSRQRFGNVGLNFRGSHHLWPISVSATVEGRPQVADRREMPLRLPLEEEITILATTTAAGPAISQAALWLAKPMWMARNPSGLERLVTRATAVVPAGSTTTWTALAPLVFERDLFSGVYAVTGASIVAANAYAFRLLFPSSRPIEGRQLRPGGLVQNTAALPPWPVQMDGLGEWGRFAGLEPPSIQVFGDAAGGTYEIRLAVTYLGESRSLLFN